MSTTPIPQPISKWDWLLTILGLVTGAIGNVFTGNIGADIKLAGVAIQIVRAANQIHIQETGQPIDMAKIPLEEPVP